MSPIAWLRYELRLLYKAPPQYLRVNLTIALTLKSDHRTTLVRSAR